MSYDVQLQNEADDYYEHENWKGRAEYAEAELESALTLTARYRADALAALARAEAAEAESARLRDENAEAWFAFDRQQSRGDRLAARVAELELKRNTATRSFVTGIGFYYQGKSYRDITVYRYDPNRAKADRGQIMRAYRSFTGASARRVQRLIEDGETATYTNGNGHLYKKFREWPE